VTDRMTRAWERLERALPKLEVEGAGLAPPASEAELQEFEAETGLVLPPELRAYWRGHAGEDPGHSGLFDFRLLSLAEAKKQLAGWAHVRERLGSELKHFNRASSSHPSEAIQRQYSTPGWLPLLSDDEGNHIGVDLNPGPAGTVGQVINFGKDEEKKYVLFPSVVELVEWLAEAIETGRIAYDEDEEAIMCTGERLVYAMQRRASTS
jgi:cell wall assembly regulator SMI1